MQPPDRAGREAILRVHARGVPLGADVDLGRIAATTPGMVGADLANLVNEAALLAARRNHEQVEEADFTDALERIVLGAERQVMMSADDRRRTAYHEGGHAIVGMLTAGADPVRKVSIIPRGMALGVTFSAPESDRFNYREPELRAKIKVALGGRAAEEVVFGETSTGAESDIQQLTEIARQMVGRWGMSQAIGPVAVLPRDGSGPLLPGAAEVSPDTQRVVDEEVRRIVEESHEQVVALLREHREQARLARRGAARARDARRGGRLRGRGRPAGRERPPPRRTQPRRRRGSTRSRFGPGVAFTARHTTRLPPRSLLLPTDRIERSQHRRGVEMNARARTRRRTAGVAPRVRADTHAFEAACGRQRPQPVCDCRSQTAERLGRAREAASPPGRPHRLGSRAVVRSFQPRRARGRGRGRRDPALRAAGAERPRPPARRRVPGRRLVLASGPPEPACDRLVPDPRRHVAARRRDDPRGRVPDVPRAGRSRSCRPRT